MRKRLLAFLCIMLVMLSIMLTMPMLGCNMRDTYNGTGSLHSIDPNASALVSEKPSAELDSESSTQYIQSTGGAKETPCVSGSITLPGISEEFDISSVPEFSGEPYYVVNNNVPFFTEDDCTTTSYEHYSELDYLGRCGAAIASIGKDLMPTEDRESIGSVRPSGWHTIKYDCVDGKYLYNRCHLIGFQLSGENANEKNLITGTRYMNVDGMLPFENMVADYVKETDNHVMYRVTPIFEGKNLVADGVLMEAYSVEDEGDGVCFNVFCYNSQPGITINYEDGSSELAADAETPKPTPKATEKPTHTPKPTQSGRAYVLNTNTHKFHYPHCSSVAQMSQSNRRDYFGDREDIIAMGYVPCKRCNP